MDNHSTDESLNQHNHSVAEEKGGSSAEPVESVEGFKQLITAQLNNYRAKFVGLNKTASLEWQLSIKSLLIVSVLVLVLAAFIVTTWLIVIASVSFSFYQAGISIWLIALSMFTVHGVLCLMLWKQINNFLKTIGFSQTVKTALS